MSNTLIIVATINAKSGYADKVGQALRDVVSPSNAEAGCLRYELHTDLGNPESFVMLEEWRDGAALDEHSATPHFRRLVDRIGNVADIRITKLNKIG